MTMREILVSFRGGPADGLRCQAEPLAHLFIAIIDGSPVPLRADAELIDSVAGAWTVYRRIDPDRGVPDGDPWPYEVVEREDGGGHAEARRVPRPERRAEMSGTGDVARSTGA